MKLLASRATGRNELDVNLTEALLSGATETAAPQLARVRALYDEHAPSLHRTLRRLAAPGIDATDLLHDVFVVALRKPEALLAAGSPRAWLFGTAVKVASDSRRRARFRRFFTLDWAAETPSDVTPLDSAEQRERLTHVQRALERLSDPKRDVLVLYELEGLSGQEIAAALGCPLKTVWTRLHHARRELESQVARFEGNVP
jgi:RNA polymerase sigma-70 factor (ECF subfamily)